MKKHINNLNKMNRADLEIKAKELRAEIVETKRGVKLGDAQNTQITKKNRRELARVLTLLSRPIEASEKPKVVKSTKKEKK